MVEIQKFPSFIIMPLFMIATLLAVIVYRRTRVSSKMKQNTTQLFFFFVVGLTLIRD